MALFIAQHQHSAEVCPAGNPQVAPMLSRHVSAQNAAQAGLKIHGEAVVDGGHTLYLIVEAPSLDQVQQFMAPFAQMGTVNVWPASLCETVVARGKC